MIAIHTLRHICPVEMGSPPVQMFGQVLENNKMVAWGIAMPQGMPIAAYQFQHCPYCKEELPGTLAGWGGPRVAADGEDRRIGFRTPGGARGGPPPLEE